MRFCLGDNESSDIYFENREEIIKQRIQRLNIDRNASERILMQFTEICLKSVSMALHGYNVIEFEHSS